MNKRIITSIILKSVVVISAIIGIVLSALASSEVFMGGHTVFMYFTIQSNILIALVCLIGLCFILLKRNTNRIWNVIKFVSTVSITLTGIVFCFVLAPTMGTLAWNLANILTHVVVPLASVIDFFVIEVLQTYRKLDVLYVTIPPLLYAIYAGIGYSLNWQFGPNMNYPYFFLNWGSKAGAFGFANELPFIGVFWWILILLLFLIGVGFLYIKLLYLFKKKNNIE